MNESMERNGKYDEYLRQMKEGEASQAESLKSSNKEKWTGREKKALTGVVAIGLLLTMLYFGDSTRSPYGLDDQKEDDKSTPIGIVDSDSSSELSEMKKSEKIRRETTSSVQSRESQTENEEEGAKMERDEKAGEKAARSYTRTGAMRSWKYLDDYEREKILAGDNEAFIKFKEEIIQIMEDLEEEIIQKVEDQIQRYWGGMLEAQVDSISKSINGINNTNNLSELNEYLGANDEYFTPFK